MSATPEKPIPGQAHVGEHTLKTTLELIGYPKKSCPRASGIQ